MERLQDDQLICNFAAMVMRLTNVLADDLLAELEAIEKDLTLYEEKNLRARFHAIDTIEFDIIDRIDAVAENTDLPDHFIRLKKHARGLISQLEEINAVMFHQLRTKIAQGDYRGQLFFKLVDEYLNGDLHRWLQGDADGYDDPDVFLNGVLSDQHLPAETKNPEPEMVFYQKTPARIIFELIKKAGFEPGDVFFDLGSGVGQVNILVNLLTGVVSKGVEFEPAYCHYASTCAAGLNLDKVYFINADARYADYSTGTIFFMYTPFNGKMFQETLQNLKAEAKKRQIKIFTYGPCTATMAKQNWLINSFTNQYSSGAFAGFLSV